MPPESFRYMAEPSAAPTRRRPEVPDASVRKMAEELVRS
jgi:4-oxalmesaconate hydratase